MERSRRQVIVDLAAAFGVIVVGSSMLGRFGFGKKRPLAVAGRAPSGTSAGRAARVRPAPFTVKRGG